MTYCVGVLLNAGLVCASDSRTNAGIDNVSSFKKMKVFERQGDRVLVIMSSGNLSMTQNVVNQLELSGKKTDGSPTIWSALSLVEVASLLGETLREVRRRDLPYLQQNNIDASASFILGGQILGEPMRLFLVYSEGNFIESTPETPFFQIGETKYGKPIIDRVITPASTLIEAEKCILVSFDSTMRSNVSVGLPIDMLTCETDMLCVRLQKRIQETDPYYRLIHTEWGEGLKRVFSQLPDPQWDNNDSPTPQYQSQIFK
jgi:putative proteasome-type protease